MDLQIIINKVNSANEFSEINLNEIRQCLDSEDLLIRCDIVEALAKFIRNEKIETMLIEKLKDKNYLVRCEACDALYESKNISTLYELFECGKKDRSSTVRMYAIATLANLLKIIEYPNELVGHIKNAYNKEKSKRVIISYMVVLYVIERDKQYVIDVLKYLNDNDYHIRCNVINILSEIFDDDEITEIIKNAYKERYVIENAYSVKSTLESFI